MEIPVLPVRVLLPVPWEIPQSIKPAISPGVLIPAGIRVLGVQPARVVQPFVQGRFSGEEVQAGYVALSLRSGVQWNGLSVRWDDFAGLPQNSPGAGAEPVPEERQVAVHRPALAR